MFLYPYQGYETSLYLSSTTSGKELINKKTYFFVLFPLVSSNTMIGGGRGGGGGGGIIGDRLAWEVLLFPFKPGKQITICFNYYQTLQKCQTGAIYGHTRQ